ncbi:hypothetical protein ACTZWW_13255 [Salinarimonas sp. NSM]|uniref:hypothetical protein n=1 Tax=Salinarimonas sp. NSM TaxID=3458003 RepID=UPI004036944D
MTKRPSSRAGRNERSQGDASREPQAPAGGDVAAEPAAQASAPSSTVIVTDEKRIAPAPPASKPAAVTAEPAGETAAEATSAAPTSAGAPTPRIAAVPEPVLDASRAGSAPSASTDEIAASAAVEAPQRAPAEDRRGGSSGLVAAVVAAVVVAGLLVAYDALFREGADTAAIEERIAAVETRATQAGESAEAARQQAESVAESVAQAAPGAQEAIAAIETRLAAVEETAQAAEEVAAAAPGIERVAELEERLAALAARIDEEIAPRLESLGSEVGRIDEATAAAEEARAAVGEAQSEMQALRENVAAEGQATRQAYLAITAANAIASALPAGTPYSSALGTLRETGIDEAIVADLAPFAETGAPTADALRAAFAEAGPLVRRALTPEDPTQDGVGSFFEGLFARAVRVEPVEGLEAPGEPALDPTATVARALALGELEAALAAWRELPEAGRAASQDFADLLAARIAAGEAARAAVEAASAALAPQAQ